MSNVPVCGTAITVLAVVHTHRQNAKCSNLNWSCLACHGKHWRYWSLQFKEVAEHSRLGETQRHRLQLPAL